MKILAFSHTGLTTGGAEQCLIEYVDVLAGRGHKCKVIMPHEGPMQAVLKKKKIDNKIIGYGWAIRPHKKVNLHKLFASNGNSLVKIFQEVEKYKPDAIVVNTSVIPWGLYAGHIFNIPTILLAHEILNEKDPSLDVLPSHDEYMRMLNGMTDIIVYNSEFVKEQFKNDLRKPVSPRSILYPLPPLTNEKIDSLYKPNVISNVLKIAVFGALAPRKNQMEVLEAAKILKDAHVTNFEIDFYGDIAANLPYVGKLKKYIRENSLDKHVKIKGFSTSVYKTMNEYNVILSASTYEPFGRTIIEGQLFGRIVIANNTGGGPELINNNQTGILYKLGDAADLAKKITWVNTHQEKALTLGRSAKIQQAKKFLKDDRYDALIEAVEGLTGSFNKSEMNDDLFNPIRSLYEYNHQLNEKYKYVVKLINNRATRFVKKAILRSRAKAKQAVKEMLAKR